MPLPAHIPRAALLGLIGLSGLTTFAAIASTPSSGDLAPWAPAVGLGVLLYLWAPVGRRGWYGAGLWVTVAAAQHLAGYPWHLALVLAGIVVAESMVIGWLVSRHVPEVRLRSLMDFMLLARAATIGTLLGATLISVAAVSLSDADFAGVFVMTVGAHLATVVVLVGLALVFREPASGVDRRLEGAVQSAALGITLVAVFAPGQTTSLAWVPIMLLVWAAARLGPRWTAVEVLLAASLVTVAIRAGAGPFIDDAFSWQTSVLLGEAYSLALVATALPLALAQHERLASVSELSQRSEQLVDQTRFTESVLRATSAVVLVVSEDGRVIDSNERASTLSGWTAAELEGFGWRRMTPPEQVHDIWDRLRRILAAGVGDEGVDIEILVKDGSRRRMNVRSVPLTGEDAGKHVLVALDVTAERNAAGWLLHILSAETTTALIGCDVTGEVIVFSRGAALLTDRSPEVVVGTPVTDLLLANAASTALPPSLDELVGASARTGEPVTRDWWLRTATGPRLTSVTTSEIDDSFGSRIGYLLLAHDVTESREAEQRLAELDAAKNEFISTASHEIRTPMTSVIGYTEMLTDGLVGPLTEAQHGIIEAIARNGQRLLALAEELLTVARFDADLDGDRHETIDLRDALRSAVEHCSGTATTRQIHLETDLPEHDVPVAGRPSDLQRLFLNLLSNAVKFSPDQGTVTCSLRHAGDHAVITIVDRGMGIPSADLEGVFERFYRADNAVRGAVQGSGLGLAIARSVVEQHEGSIHVVSEEGAGSTFTVTLPVSDPERPETLRRG